MPRIITESEKLISRINREFERKKFIGDIKISDEEYGLLLINFQRKFAYLLSDRNRLFEDPVLAVTMVQIGIRKYDGNYWNHVGNALGYSNFSQVHQTQLGWSFIKTIQKYKKLQLGESERINTMLMHGFVSDKYADRFFDFLFAFYQIDLERDITRLDRAMMNSLIEVMCRSDNTGRTYNLVAQTADAVRMSPRSAKTRVRRYLKLIDNAFWNENLPESSSSRIIRRLIEWTKVSNDFESRQRQYISGTGRRKKSFSSPYITCDFNNNEFFLHFPSQTIEFREEKYGQLGWEIESLKTSGIVDIEIVGEGVTGYRTEDITVQLNKDDVFSEITLLLKNDQETLRRFKIKKERIRFFDENGMSTNIDGLRSGRAFSYSNPDFEPMGRGVSYSEIAGGLRLTVFELENGDLILLPDGKPISVGSDIREGLQQRGGISGMFASKEERPVSVYSDVPQIVFRALERRLVGTAVYLDGNVYRLEELNVQKNCLLSFDLNDRSGEKGFLLDLPRLGLFKDGMHEIRIDIPNDHSTRCWKFLLINGFTYAFEGAPYVFKSRGTLTFPLKYDFKPLDGGKIEREKECFYNFEIEPGSPILRLGYLNSIVHFEVPALSYRFEGEDWQIAPHMDIWHSDFKPKLYLDYDKDKIRFFMGNLDDEGEEHSEVFEKNKERGLFECDLNRFKSWFGREQINRNVYLELPDVPEPICFIKVVTRSFLVSGLLTADLNKDLIEGNFEIIGKAEYYVDLFLKDDQVAEKIHLENGKFAVETTLKTGLYRAVVYEAEVDDSGFGDDVFYKIGEKELDLINPSDLNGKSIEVDSLLPVNNEGTYFPLKYHYKIVGLSNQETASRHDYVGKMMVRGEGSERLFATFPVNVNFYDLNDLRSTYITFDEEGDQLEFLYDEDRKKIVKREDKSLRIQAAYRRYKYSLFPKDFVFRVNFFNPSEEELSLEADEGEYNNLVVRNTRFTIFRKTGETKL